MGVPVGFFLFCRDLSLHGAICSPKGDWREKEVVHDEVWKNESMALSGIACVSAFLRDLVIGRVSLVRLSCSVISSLILLEFV